MAVINGLGAALQNGGGVMGQGAARGIASPSAPGRDFGVAAPAGGGGDFAKALGDALSSVDDKQQVADDKAIALVSGQDIPIHEVMVAVTDAELAVGMTTAVVAKAIAAYQEIWRMEV